MALASVQKFLFGPTPEERVKQWQQQIKKEARLLDREIRQLDGAQAKTKSQLKQLANKGDVKNAKLLAREVVRSNKQKDRLATSKARLNSINMQLTHQLCGCTTAHKAPALTECRLICIILRTCSYTQDHWAPSEVYGDHEALE